MASSSNAPLGYDMLLKLILIGDLAAGKSSLIHRYRHDTFVLGHVATIGVDFEIKTITVDDKRVKLQLWDTAGQERFRHMALTRAYYRGSHGLAVVFDLTNRATFDSVPEWFDSINKQMTTGASKMLIGTKMDQQEERAVSMAEAMDLAAEMDAIYIETSAKYDIQVQDAFDILVRDALRTREEVEARLHENNVDIGHQWIPNGFKCCV